MSYSVQEGIRPMWEVLYITIKIKQVIHYHNKMEFNTNLTAANITKEGEYQIV